MTRGQLGSSRPHTVGSTPIPHFLDDVMEMSSHLGYARPISVLRFDSEGSQTSTKALVLTRAPGAAGQRCGRELHVWTSRP